VKKKGSRPEREKKRRGEDISFQEAISPPDRRIPGAKGGKHKWIKRGLFDPSKIKRKGIAGSTCPFPICDAEKERGQHPAFAIRGARKTRKKKNARSGSQI